MLIDKTIIEYEFIELKLHKHDKYFRLPYWQKILIKLKEQTKHNISKLRRKGYKIVKRNEEYYLVYKQKTLNKASKKKITRRILDTKLENNLTLEEFLKYKQDKDSVKTKKCLNDLEYSTFLSILGTFWIINKNDNYVLTMKNIKRIRKYEITEFGEYLYEWKRKNKNEIKKINKNKLKKFEAANKRKIKRWKKSKTYKLNIIFKNYDKYTSKWIYVNNTNTFSFLNKKYMISDKVKNYKVDSDNQSNMDTILCIRNDATNTIKFYDMNIDEISSDLIKK